MDDIDKGILRVIQEDTRTGYQEIAKRLSIAPSTVHFRIKKLINMGVIERFSAILNLEKMGYMTIAWIGLSCDPDKIDSVADILASFDQIQMVCTASGDHDLLIQIVAKNEKDLWRFINKNIKTISGVEKDFDVSCFLDVYKKTNSIVV
ncbi:hypothetical protein COV93_01360 [Candidatus Woesearchaeota archaeon CG11_big_fil_rev_8_21_14_0_20_43_8]|nr:MAG: hypothetical protein COV93_01360 [Candidatus Woesearchaeota archaeon CG11_big_fil_rev_8_21_14_0_20_43_8]